MTRDWKPGDVAVVQMGHGPQAAIFTGKFWAWSDGSGPYEGVSHCHRNATATPAIVIELPKGCLGGWDVLVNSLVVAREKTGFTMTFDGLIEQIEAQTKVAPPKPDEPTGLGAVVEDEDGLTWVRRHPAGPAWVNGYQRWAAYADIAAVRVLSEGAQ